MRRAAAEAVRGNGIAGRFGDAVSMEEADGGELVVRLDPALPHELVDAWGRERFPETYPAGGFGSYQDAEGGEGRLVSLAFTQLLIADLTQKMRRPADPVPNSAESAGASV